MVPSPTYFQLLLEFFRGVYWPPHFSALIWTGFWGGCQKYQAEVYHLGILRTSDDFRDDAVIFAETLDILVRVHEALKEESEPLGLQVSWVTIKIQAFTDILDVAVVCLCLR